MHVLKVIMEERDIAKRLTHARSPFLQEFSSIAKFIDLFLQFYDSQSIIYIIFRITWNGEKNVYFFISQERKQNFL